MENKGIFIVLEGTDGSGKGTQFKLLTEALRGQGYDVEIFDFPQYDKPSSYFVKQYLNGAYGTAEEVGPYTGSLFYALDRYEAGPRIQAALDAGKVVLANRYTGSNMAHQGAKFVNAEERRGYFLWLDSIEFQMLGVPRPTLNIVLRVPADIAQKLVDQKAAREYTDKKRDIHEADLGHLEQAVRVYDDLCNIFPKDFWALDCVRSGELLSIDSVHSLILAKVLPLLPPSVRSPKDLPSNSRDNTPEGQSVAGATTVSTSAVSRTEHEVDALSEVQLTGVSNLVLSRTSRAQDCIITESASGTHGHAVKDENGDYLYYIPEQIDEQTRAEYCKHMDYIYDTYAAMSERLATYIHEHSSAAARHGTVWKNAAINEARAILSPVLPLASTTRVTVTATADALNRLIDELRRSDMDEAGRIATTLGGNDRARPELSVPNATVPFAQQDRSSQAGKLIKAYMSETHTSGQPEKVSLTDIWPTNEINLVGDIAYTYSSMPLQNARQTVSEWDYGQKSEVLRAYLSEQLSEKITCTPLLHKALYGFDLVTDFATFRAMHDHGFARDIEPQELTPRYGFAVPPLVEAAGLTDDFEDCFGVSLKLHSLLQQAGFVEEAAYAVLRGHLLRWKADFDAYGISQLYLRYQAPADYTDCFALVQQMLQKIAERHPLMAEAIHSHRAQSD